MNLLFSLDMDDCRDDEHATVIGEAMETLILRNLMHLDKHPGTLPLYESGVRYKFNPGMWQDIPSTLRSQTGNCTDLVAWRVAELRRQKEPAMVHVELVGSDLFHVSIRRKDGRIEDPSRKLGMRGLEGLI
jgi:hypothetical protein